MSRCYSSVLRRWTLRAVKTPTWPSTGRVRRLSPSITPKPCPGSSRVLDPSSTCPTRVKNRSDQSIRCQTTKQKWVSLKFQLLNPMTCSDVQIFPLYATNKPVTSLFCSKLPPNRYFICHWLYSSHRLNFWCTCSWIWSINFGSTRKWWGSWGRSSGSSTRRLTIAFTTVY